MNTDFQVSGFKVDGGTINYQGKEEGQIWWQGKH